jgi:cyclase
MLTKRIIPCLDIKDGMVVKGVGFRDIAAVGNPIKMAKRYYLEGADELCLLDISASEERRKTMVELIANISKEAFIPITVGGGIESIEDISLLLKNGADKISLCTSAVNNPGLIKEAAKKFGSQCIVISLDVKRRQDYLELFIYGGKKSTGIDAFEFALECKRLGAGEILINSLDYDGTGKGYDLEMIKKIATKVNIPIIASSGAGALTDIKDAFEKGYADAVLAASIFHYNRYSIMQVKEYLRKEGIEVRP